MAALSAFAGDNLVTVSAVLAPGVPAATALVALFIISTIVVPIVFLFWGDCPNSHRMGAATMDAESKNCENSRFVIAR